MRQAFFSDRACVRPAIRGQHRAFGQVVTEQFAPTGLCGATRGLMGLIQSFASSAAGVNVARPAFAAKSFARILVLQQCVGVVNPAVEEARHDVSLYGESACLQLGSMHRPAV